MAKNILKLEQRVKDIYYEDKTNPELYLAIKDLAEAILVVKRMVSNSTQVATISHELATDFYMDICSGKLEVRSWTKYVMLRLGTYRGRYYSDTRSVDLVVSDLVDQGNLASTLYSSSKFCLSKESSLELEDLIEYYPQFLLKQYDKCVRYVKGSVEYSNTLISVMLTLLRGNGTVKGVVKYRSTDDPEYILFLSKLLMRRLECYSNILCLDSTLSSSLNEELVHSFKSFCDE